ncbi:MAG TPA: hypothetical protein VK698_12470 [Kofleriaceae bacterium]|nr:hypothetical protein [Kofleriaceae bacterium]
MDPNQSKEQQKEIPVNLNRDIDILWVIDNSSSMDQEQNSLARNFPEFVRVLETIEGGLPNIHMGVVSSDVGTGDGDGNGLDRKCDGQGDDGRLLAEGDPSGTPCPALTDGASFIEDIAVNEDGTMRQANYTGLLEDQFSCMAVLGTEGCGFEQHLESMRRALTEGNNPGFLRDDAFLAVIFIQDEDDCSASDRSIFGGNITDSVDDQFGEYSSFRCFEYGTACDPDSERTLGPRESCVPDENSAYIEKVSNYIDFLKGVKDDPSKVIVAEITAPATPVTVANDESKDELWVRPACVVCADGGTDCPGALGSEADPQTLVAARPSVRMSAFLEGFAQRSTFQSICNYDPEINDVDLSGALTQIGLLLKKVVGNPCLDGKLTDTEPSIDGFQADCRVSDVRDINLDTEEEFPIPACENASAPCFQLVQNDSCNTDSNLALDIDRGDPPQDPPSNTTVVVRCLVE